MVLTRAGKKQTNAATRTFGVSVNPYQITKSGATTRAGMARTPAMTGITARSTGRLIDRRMPRRIPNPQPMTKPMSTSWRVIQEAGRNRSLASVMASATTL